MILIAGSANLDFVVRASHIPAPGETVLGRDFQTFPGGKGANQAVACARAGGVPTAMLLALGNDAFAVPLLESLTQAGVQLHTVRVPNASTGTAFICVSDDGENAITVAPGANHGLLPQHLPSLHGVSHLLMQLETPLPTVLAYARAAKAQGVQVVLNAAPAPTPGTALLPELLALVDVLIVNQGELAALTSATATLTEQLAQLPVPCVVVTLGGAGCMARMTGHNTAQQITQPIYKVHVVDTTGAGDTFCGVLVAALSQGTDMPTALQRASAAGALACTKMGAQSSIPTQQAVAQLMQQ
jgi:ribokinase